MYDTRDDGPPGSFLSYFGDELRLFRERAGLTQGQVGERTWVSGDLISKIERAERVPQADLCAALDELFGSDGHFQRLGERIRRHSGTSSRFRAYLDREPAAVVLNTYEAVFVPGLLQTEDYARAVIESDRPTPTAEQVQSRLATRLSRADMLSRDDPPQFWAVLWEAVLHVRIGPPETMKAQLGHLLDCAALPHITIQVLPYTAGAVGPLTSQPFLLASFDDGPDALHIDALPSAAENPATLGRYRLQFDHLRALALPERESHEMIRGAMSA